MAFFMMMCVSCVEDVHETVMPSGEERSVPLSFNVISEYGGFGTKALEAAVDEVTVTDFWLLEFKADGGIQGAPRYYIKDADTELVSLIFPGEDEEAYTVVAIANTHDPYLNKGAGALAGISSINDLMAKGQNVHAFKDTYVDGKDLLMSGTAVLESTSADLEIDFYRNVAKLTVTVENSAESGVEVKSVQVCNVPQKIFYADRLHDHEYNNGGLNYYNVVRSPDASETSFFNYDVDACEVLQGQDNLSAPLVYYLPRNCRGAGNSSSEYNKNRNPVVYSTYVEVLAKKMVGGTPLRYRFYLGEDMKNDYNVVANHHYTLPVKITGVGDVVMDSRVEDLGKVPLEVANCYIVNPLSTDMQQVYELPATARVNEFWDLPDAGDSNIGIHSGDRWVAEVIWQDVQGKQLITFCNEDGSVTSADGTVNTSVLTEFPFVYEGEGRNAVYFKPVQGARGNVLIGIRKEQATNEHYLWSWHLWITDYAPDERTASWDERYVYPVTGGHVHRYDDATGKTTWSRTYLNKYIMDRNLGAMGADLDPGTPNGESLFHFVTGLSYQYGRKDPFPIYTSADNKATLYNIVGDPIPKEGIYAGISNDHILRYPHQVSLATAVNKPHTFFNVAQNDTWVLENPYGGMEWNRPIGMTGKSLFDPCPYGWRIPDIDTWAIFIATPPNGTWKDSGWNMNISRSTEPDAPTAFYLATGYRSGGSGIVDYGLERSYLWSDEITDGKRAKSQVIQTDDGTKARTASSYRTMGFSIRCIRE